jgi:hypothetical protein
MDPKLPSHMKCSTESTITAPEVKSPVGRSEYEAIFATAANMQDAKDAGGN